MGVKRFTKGSRLILISSLLITGFITGLKQTGIFESLELRVFDYPIAKQSDASPDPRIAIVGITEEDCQIYVCPLSDAVLAQTLAILQTHQPRVIGLDIYRNIPRQPGEAAIARELSRPNLVAIYYVGNDPINFQVPPPPEVAAERLGFNDVATDLDGVIRRSLVFVSTPDRDYYSFGLRIVQIYMGLDDTAITDTPEGLHLGGAWLPRLQPQDGGYQQVDSAGQQVILRYRSRKAPAAIFSVDDVLQGRYDPELFHDKAVLVGTTANSVKDLFLTPYSTDSSQNFLMPGVVLHAQMVSQLLDVVAGRPALYRSLPPWSEILWLWGWCLIASALVWRLRHLAMLFVVSGTTLVLLVGASGLALTHLIWLPIAEPAIGFLATSGVALAHKLLYRSTHDSLTGLPNRETFIAQIGRVLMQNQRLQREMPVVVVFLDIDRFKVINESLGHRAGDEVLQMLAQRLQCHLPFGAKAARVGGDEFAIVLQGMSPEIARQFIDQLQAALSAPVPLGDRKFPNTVSMGVAMTQLGYNHKPTDLLRDAHTAMYRAKALGKSRYEVFAAGMLTEAVNRLQLESDLISALENQEFLLYYQPIVDLAAGRIAGFEALVRWKQVDRGFVLPGAFIPAAEETGLILPLGHWIFREACHQLQVWQEAYPHYGPLTMSINLSNRQFTQVDLVQQIQSAIADSGVSGDRIRLEITESMVMGDVEGAIDLMLELKKLNVRLGIDDFGTGYSSLSYLHRFPMDTLKVDKSFVGRVEKSAEDYAIVQTILTLGHQLGMDVVAEGIETTEQFHLLRQEKCNYGQGYYFAKPLPSEAAGELLRQDRRW